jgi:hypothetical protein
LKQEFQSFWFGENLSPYEILCLKSFIDRGHAFKLYTYGHLVVPAGVQLVDAGEVLPKDSVFFYQHWPESGSVAAFANRFRYALLAKFGGWWVDMDMVCLSDDFESFETFFALEEPGKINNAMLRFPSQHVAMLTCLEQATLLGQNIGWGMTGPQLITKVLSELNLSDSAQPPHSCYPIKWTKYLDLFDPKMRTLVEQRTELSIGVHLWNEMIRRTGVNKFKAPPTGSFLDSLFERLGVTFPAGRYQFRDIYYLHKLNQLKARLKKGIRA